jgi:hypothetical protein
MGIEELSLGDTIGIATLKPGSRSARLLGHTSTSKYYQTACPITSDPERGRVMQESAPKLSLHQCREVTRVRRDQVQKLLTSSLDKKDIYAQVSDAFTQTILALSEYVGDEEINKNVEAFVKAYDQLAVQLGIPPYITEVEDVEEGEPENPVDEA